MCVCVCVCVCAGSPDPGQLLSGHQLHQIRVSSQAQVGQALQARQRQRGQLIGRQVSVDEDTGSESRTRLSWRWRTATHSSARAGSAEKVWGLSPASRFQDKSLRGQAGHGLQEASAAATQACVRVCVCACVRVRAHRERRDVRPWNVCSSSSAISLWCRSLFRTHRLSFHGNAANRLEQDGLVRRLN